MDFWIENEEDKKKVDASPRQHNILENRWTDIFSMESYYENKPDYGGYCECQQFVTINP